VNQVRPSIALLSTQFAAPIRSLLKTAETHSYNLSRVNPGVISASKLSADPLLESLSHFDVIYYRSGLRSAALQYVYDLLPTQETVLVGWKPEHAMLHLKSTQAIIAGLHNIPQPNTVTVTTFDHSTLVEQLGAPFVAKPDHGQEGIGVTLVDSEAVFANTMQGTTKRHWVFQEFIAAEAEYRVYTLAGKAVAGYVKEPRAGEFRGNVRQGARIGSIGMHEQNDVFAFCEHIAEAFRVDIAGIDVLRSGGSLTFLEINLQPGWKGLDMLGYDLSEDILAFLETQAPRP
jgi:hypothetical protein